MYQKIKYILKGLFPKKLLFKYELIFRLILYQFYRGSKFQCNICKKELRQFVTTENGDALCPSCGSLPRNRRLWSILNGGFLKSGTKVLDFSPSRCLYRILKNYPSLTYVSTDLSGDFIADHTYIITAIDAADDSYDVVVCYHILEHIEHDLQAMKELYRILRPDGICLVQTPFKGGPIYEDFTIQSEAERLKHFGQEDHVRIYSVDGLKERLTANGFKVEIMEYIEREENKFGYSKKEIVLFCRK